MKSLLLALSLFSACAFAQGNSKMHNVLIDVGFPEQGFKFGGTYEYVYNGAQGIGGQFHYYPKKEATSTTAFKTGYMIIGAMTGFHFYKGDWDFSLSPSFNLMNIDRNAPAEDKTGFGPGLSIGLTTAINDKVAIGFALNNYWAWFGEEIRGHHIDDLNFRVKVGF